MSNERGLIIDLFFGKYMGGLKQLEESENYPPKVKPKIKIANSHPKQLPKRSNVEEFPYSLDREENIKTLRGYASFPIKILIPTDSVPDLPEDQLEKTIWKQIQKEKSNEAEKWRQRYMEEKDELESKKKELRDLRKEREQIEEREQASKSSTSNNVNCPKCDSSNPQNRWEDSNGYCPSCGNVTLEEVKG